MQLPVKISYRGLEKSDQIDNLVLDYAARLEKFCDHINRCDVAIEQTNHTHQKGNPYRCRIDVTVSRGHELVADERQMDNGSHQPLNKEIHDAFKTMERELRRVVDKQDATSKRTPIRVRRNNCQSLSQSCLRGPPNKADEGSWRDQGAAVSTPPPAIYRAPLS